jgi:hypothetical protein
MQSPRTDSTRRFFQWESFDTQTLKSFNNADSTVDVIQRRLLDIFNFTGKSASNGKDVYE